MTKKSNNTRAVTVVFILTISLSCTTEKYLLWKHQKPQPEFGYLYGQFTTTNRTKVSAGFYYKMVPEKRTEWGGFTFSHPSRWIGRRHNKRYLRTSLRVLKPGVYRIYEWFAHLYIGKYKSGPLAAEFNQYMSKRGKLKGQVFTRTFRVRAGRAYYVGNHTFKAKANPRTGRFVHRFGYSNRFRQDTAKLVKEFPHFRSMPKINLFR